MVSYGKSFVLLLWEQTRDNGVKSSQPYVIEAFVRLRQANNRKLMLIGFADTACDRMTHGAASRAESDENWAWMRLNHRNSLSFRHVRTLTKGTSARLMESEEEKLHWDDEWTEMDLFPNTIRHYGTLRAFLAKPLFRLKGFLCNGTFTIH